MLAFSEVAVSLRDERDPTKFPGINKVWEYLAKRGITREIADKCSLHIVKAVELIAAARNSPSIYGADTRAAIVFPHWKLGQEAPIDWWSARLVDVSESSDSVRLVASFGDLVEKKPLGKMFCPPNEPPHGYIPPIYNWKGLPDNEHIYIHESAIKALNGAALGYASIGLNGVWGWGSRKHNIALIDELRSLPWKQKKLQPVIVFDSNAWDNWQVQQAETFLAAKLYEITGQRAVALRVPKHEGEDQGFDDYRARVGDDVARRFLSGTAEGNGFLEVEISEYQQMMLQLNAEVCVVRSLGRIANQSGGDLMSRHTFVDVNYANFTTEIEVGDGVRKVNVAKAWLESENRVQVRSLKYAPGQPKFIRNETGLPDLNLWKGMGVEPEKGDIEPWLDLLVNCIPDEDIRQWLIAWFAYPLQNLGKKIISYPLIFGPSGTGKNNIVMPIHRIYGGNSIIITRSHLKSEFNSVYSAKQLVHVDEIKDNRGGNDNVAQKVKFLISSEKDVVNTKGQPEYEIPNCANYIVTDNYWDCLKLDSDDRRACVIRWEGQLDRRGDQKYWANYVRWAQGMGANALYDWLLRQDIRWFDPSAWAPATKWKEQVTEASMTPIESWVHDLILSPTETLPLIGANKALWTAKELAVVFYGESESELSPGKIKAMANALRNAGFAQAHGGALIRRPGGVADRFWVIQRREEIWDLAQCREHLKQVS